VDLACPARVAIGMGSLRSDMTVPTKWEWGFFLLQTVDLNSQGIAAAGFTYQLCECKLCRLSCKDLGMGGKVAAYISIILSYAY